MDSVPQKVTDTPLSSARREYFAIIEYLESDLFRRVFSAREGATYRSPLGWEATLLYDNRGVTVRTVDPTGRTHFQGLVTLEDFEHGEVLP